MTTVHVSNCALALGRTAHYTLLYCVMSMPAYIGNNDVILRKMVLGRRIKTPHGTDMADDIFNDTYTCHLNTYTYTGFEADCNSTRNLTASTVSEPVPVILNAEF